MQANRGSLITALNEKAEKENFTLTGCSENHFRGVTEALGFHRIE